MFMKWFENHHTLANLNFPAFACNWLIGMCSQEKQGRESGKQQRWKDKEENRGKGGKLGNLDPAGSFGILVIS